MRCVPLCLLIGLVCSIGCGTSATVSGKATLDGKPLATGEVLFHPQGEGALATGTISNGEYRLSVGAGDNLEPGTYRVTVRAVEYPEAPAANETGKPVEVVGKLVTPEKYGDAETTPFEFTVKSGANRIDLPLKSQ